MSRKSGLDYLKEKYAALQAQNSNLQGIIEQQQTTISRLQADLHNEYTNRLREKSESKRLCDEMLEHMGFFHRLTWKLKNKE